MVQDGRAYKIWGIDNLVYGPVELPVLVSWVREERVNATTWIHEECSDCWQKAAEISELQLFFGRNPPTKATPAHETEVTAKAPSLKPGSLRRIKVFGGFSDEQLTRFVGYMEVRQTKQFSHVVRQGEPGDAMFLILQGEVRVRMMIGEKETTLATLSSGDFFGEISLFDHGPRSADVVANEETILLRVSASSFRKLTDEAPDLAAPFLLAMGRTMTGRIRADNKRFRDTVAFQRSALYET